MTRLVKRRAISPVIATLLLMAVSVVGAAAVWQQMQQQTLVSGKSTSYQIVNVSLVKLHSGQAYFSITMKNTGSTAITSTTVGFYDDSSSFNKVTDTATIVNPGSQWSSDTTFTAAVTPDTQYAIQINGISQDGAHYSAGSTVVATGTG